MTEINKLRKKIMNKCSTNGRSFGKSYKYEIIRIANQFVGNMYKLLPEGQIGKYSIVHKLVTKKDCELELDRMRLSFNFKDYLQLKEGMYTYLMEEDHVWMSDTHTEIMSNLNFLSEAKGDILILGLGIAAIPLILLDINKKYNNISSITIVEKSKEVINLVSDPLGLERHIDVILDCCFRYEPYKIFDMIYGDIWGDLDAESEEDKKVLDKKYSKYLKPNGKLLFWEQKIDW